MAPSSGFSLSLLVVVLLPRFPVTWTASTPFEYVFPLHGAVFLPHDQALVAPDLFSGSSEVSKTETKYMATLESVRPILDVAIADSHRRYLRHWIPHKSNWLNIIEAPILECENQKRAAWAALEAVQWTNGSGLDVAFGPACDYVLATVSRILSFHRVPMFTNAGFSEFFQTKPDSLLTRVGPLQDHITMMVGQLGSLFSWKRPQLIYEKTFWESELREAGFCKLLMNGMYFRSVQKKWDLHVNPRMLPSFWDNENPRLNFTEFLKENVGINYGGYAFVYALAPVARMAPHWEDEDSHGIPVITSIGLTANLDNRNEYQLMTRISSPYKVVKDAVMALFLRMNWLRTVYLFHDRRHGMTKPDIPYGECYLMMASLEPYLSRFHRMEHNYFMFNELHYNREGMREHLKKASMFSNGWFAFSKLPFSFFSFILGKFFAMVFPFSS